MDTVLILQPYPGLHKKSEHLYVCVSVLLLHIFSIYFIMTRSGPTNASRLRIGCRQSWRGGLWQEWGYASIITLTHNWAMTKTTLTYMKYPLFCVLLGRFRQHWQAESQSEEQWRWRCSAEILCRHQQSAPPSQISPGLLWKTTQEKVDECEGYTQAEWVYLHSGLWNPWYFYFNHSLFFPVSEKMFSTVMNWGIGAFYLWSSDIMGVGYSKLVSVPYSAMQM